ncbi:acetate--CoA ligase family protein [Bosea thiooxidans]
MAIETLFNPRSIAVVGASTDATKTSGLPIKFLRQQGFAGAIYPVNPRVSEIDGLPCYASIAALPAQPDVAMVLLGAGRSVDAVRELAARGTQHAIVLASGFGEAGEDGRQRQAMLIEAAGSMRILGPNTIGLVNVTDGVPLSASGALASGAFLKGPVGVVSQSGGILGALLSRAAARGIGLSKLVSTSNEADLEIADFIDYLADDPQTSVIALYVETIRNPASFRCAALKARAAGKPIVALKIGRSDAGARAAASHTGAMAGSDRAYDAFFRELGVIRAQTFGDLIDIPAALSTQPVLKGKRVAVLTSTGGAGTLVADGLGLIGFEAPVPDSETIEKLRAAMPDGHGALDGNPIDITLAGLQPDILKRCIESLLESPSYDALTVVVGSSSVAQPELISDAIRAAAPAGGKPVLAYVSPHAPEAAARLTQQGVPAFNAPEAVASAFCALWIAGQLPPQAEPPADRPVVDLPPDWQGSLNETQAKALFAKYGLPGVGERVVSNPDDARAAAAAFGGQVVLKILSSTITHKSDVGGVAVSLDADSIAARLGTMASEVETRTGIIPDGYLVQEMVPPGGLELILGCHRDPLGAVLLLGMGGVAAELMQDTTIRLLAPGLALGRDEALVMARELKTWPLLDGYRGRPKLDVEALVTSIVDFSAMVAQLGERLVEAEINPLFVLPVGQGVRAADGVAVLQLQPVESPSVGLD